MNFSKEVNGQRSKSMANLLKGGPVKPSASSATCSPVSLVSTGLLARPTTLSCASTVCLTGAHALRRRSLVRLCLSTSFAAKPKGQFHPHLDRRGRFRPHMGQRWALCCGSGRKSSLQSLLDRRELLGPPLRINCPTKLHAILRANEELFFTCIEDEKSFFLIAPHHSLSHPFLPVIHLPLFPSPSSLSCPFPSGHHLSRAFFLPDSSLILPCSFPPFLLPCSLY